MPWFQTLSLTSVLQIHAVYDCHWKVTGFAAGIVVAGVLGASVFDFRHIPRGKNFDATIISSEVYQKSDILFLGAALPLNLSGCYFVDRSSAYVWACALITDAFLCLFMLYRAWWMFTENRRSSMLALIVRDR